MKPWHFKMLGALTGLGGGLLYYYLIGCAGSCAIWSNPFLSAGYGSLLGFLGISMFVNSKNEPSENDSPQR